MNKHYEFIARALLAEEALDKSGRKNHRAFKFDEEKMSERLGVHLLDNELVERARKMGIVYTAICAFENGVREFITKKLLERFGENWWEQGVSEKIRKAAKFRKEEEDKIKWHSTRGNVNLLHYTLFGDLSSIIVANWESFEPHMHIQEWATQIIDSLERSRNVIMHGGELAQEDVERVGINIRDWLRQVGA